jgi:hypothetical protein
MLRSKGEAAPGIVRVEGGADQVRMPRLPKLPPPPIRASAIAGARAKRPARNKILSDPRFNAKNRNMANIPPIEQDAHILTVDIGADSLRGKGEGGN